MHKIKILFKAILIFLAVLFVVVIVQSSMGLIGVTLTGNPTSSVNLFLERSSMIIVAALLTIWAEKKREKLYNIILRAIPIEKDKLFVLGKTILLVLGILYAVFIASGLLDQYEFVHSGTEEYPVIIILNQLILVGILGNILVAIGEEIIFRGFLLNYIANISSSKLFALLFTSFVFSLHPYQDFLNYAIAFAAGFIMGYAYLKFKTLYIPIGIHFAYNFFNFTIASAPGRGPQLPYLVKFDYLMIQDGFGAWIDLSIIFGFLLILLILWQKPSFKKN